MFEWVLYTPLVEVAIMRNFKFCLKIILKYSWNNCIIFYRKNTSALKNLIKKSDTWTKARNSQVSEKNRLWRNLKMGLINNSTFINLIANKKTLCVVTIAIICSNLSSLWKSQCFRRPIYNPVKDLWWSFICKNSKPLSIFIKKLHRRCLLGF